MMKAKHVTFDLKVRHFVCNGRIVTDLQALSLWRAKLATFSSHAEIAVRQYHDAVHELCDQRRFRDKHP